MGTSFNQNRWKKGTREVIGCCRKTLFFGEFAIGDTSLGSSGGSHTER